jgi:hypothetical protein
MEENNAGQMFAGSYLRKTTPFHHFLLALIFGLVGIATAKLIFTSQEGIGFMGCFGLLFYAMFNPWLFLLANNMLQYFLYSLALYVLLAVIMFGSIYLLTGESVFNQWSLKIILISSTFFFFVAYGTMRLTKTVLDDDSKL